MVSSCERWINEGYVRVNVVDLRPGDCSPIASAVVRDGTMYLTYEDNLPTRHDIHYHDNNKKMMVDNYFKYVLRGPQYTEEQELEAISWLAAMVEAGDPCG